MIVALLVLIVLILLFGAGAVKGFLTGAFAWIIGGGAGIVLLVWVGSYLGDYGLLWIMGIVAAVFAIGIPVEDHFRKRAHQKMLDQLQSGDWRRPPPE